MRREFLLDGDTDELPVGEVVEEADGDVLQYEYRGDWSKTKACWSSIRSSQTETPWVVLERRRRHLTAGPDDRWLNAASVGRRSSPRPRPRELVASAREVLEVGGQNPVRADVGALQSAIDN